MVSFTGPKGRFWLCQTCARNVERMLEARKADEAVQARIRQAGIPERHRDKANLEIEPAWTETFRGLESKLGTGCLYTLHGGRGPGKTRMACECIKVTCSRGSTARYATAMRFFLAVRATFSKGSTQTESEVLDTFIAPKLLVLDEVGVRGSTSFEDRLLTSAIGERYDKMLDTIIVSNQTEADLRGALGESIVDRMHEAGGFVECKWASFRGRLGDGADG